MKNVSLFSLSALASSMLVTAPIGAHAEGLILQNDYPWMKPFVAQRDPGPNDVASKSYFTDKSGRIFGVDNKFIDRIVLIPKADEFSNISDELSLARLVAKETELEGVIAKVPEAQTYVAKSVAALRLEIRRFRSGERKLNGKWFAGADYEKLQADIAAPAKAAAKAEESAQIAQQRAVEERRRIQETALEEQRIQEWKLLEAKQEEAWKIVERERTKEERNATDDLKETHAQFETMEQSSAKSLQSRTKGTLSGQIFVATKGGENVKLGAVQVSLFDREAVNLLLAGIRAYADKNIQLQTARLAAAEGAQQRADSRLALARAALAKDSLQGKDDVWLRVSGTSNAAAKAARAAAESEVHAAEEIVRAAQKRYSMVEINNYSSGAFYFRFLLPPIQIAETDAEGRFVIEVPTTGRFVIAARANRRVGSKVERYYWLAPVALDGQQQRVQNLSNSNLTSANGTSSLIVTMDNLEDFVARDE